MVVLNLKKRKLQHTTTKVIREHNLSEIHKRYIEILCDNEWHNSKSIKKFVYQNASYNIYDCTVTENIRTLKDLYKLDIESKPSLGYRLNTIIKVGE